MKKTTKTLKMLIALLMALLTLPSFPAVAEEAHVETVPVNDNPLAMDIVILIDQSDRMVNAKGIGADPEGYRMDAAMIMISMCDMEYSTAAINWYGLYYRQDGKVPFDKLCLGQLNPLNTSIRSRYYEMLRDRNSNKFAEAGSDGLVNFGSPTQKTYYTEQFDGGMYHDFATSFSRSVDLLANSESGNRKVILLIAAGEPHEPFFDKVNNTGTASQKINKENQERTELFYTTISNAQNVAEKNGIEIYVIDINTAGSGGSAHTLTDLDSRGDPDVITSATELPITMNRIFAYLIGSEMHTKISGGKINIPNNSVKEVNIIVPKKGNDDISLWAPDAAQPLNENVKSTENHIITDSPHFKTYKLLNPEDGDWTLKNGNIPMDADIQYVFSYDVIAESTFSCDTMENNSFGKAESFDITTFFTQDGEKSKDSALYKSITAKLVIKKGTKTNSGNLIDVAEIEMSGSEEECRYTYTKNDIFPDLSAGTYSFFIRLEGAGLYREEHLGDYTLVNNAPVVNEKLSDEAKEKETALTGFICNSPDGEDTNVMEPIELDLDEYFIDPDGDERSYSIVGKGSDEVATATVNGTKLTITPHKGGETIITIACEDDEESSKQREFKVVVKDVAGRYSDCNVELVVSVAGEKKEVEGAYSVDKGAEISFTHNVIGTTKEGNVPELKDVKYTITPPEGEKFAATGFTAQNKEGEYQVILTGKFGEEQRTASATITVTNKTPTLTNAGEKLPDELPKSFDGGGFILSIFGDQPEGKYWIGSKYLCSPTGPQEFDVSQYFEDADGVHDELTYTVSLYAPETPDENGEMIPGEALIENEPIELVPAEEGTECDESYRFVLENGIITQEGKHKLVFKATDNDGASEELTIEIDAASVVGKAEENFKRLVLYIVIGVIAAVIIIRMLMPKFKEGMHFYIKIDDVSIPGAEPKELRSLGKPKADHPMNQIYDSYFALEYNDAVRIEEDAFRFIVLKPAYGNRIKVEVNKTAFDARPENVRVTVADKPVTSSNFRHKLSPYGRICFQEIDENQQPVGAVLEYVFMDRFEQ